MNTIKLLLIAFILLFYASAEAQKSKQIITTNPKKWTVFNREVSYNDKVIHLNAKEYDGILWLNNSDFKNGAIEFDIKGKNVPQKSFVGLAFHGLNDSTFDAIYFRPFNFKNPERNSHSVQYISMPKYHWKNLREAYPGKYENTIDPVPEPVDDWFHVKVVIDYPDVKVYVNNSEQASLEVEQISDRKHGKVGFWVGYGSEGWFRNLKILKLK